MGDLRKTYITLLSYSENKLFFLSKLYSLPSIMADMHEGIVTAIILLYQLFLYIVSACNNVSIYIYLIIFD